MKFDAEELTRLTREAGAVDGPGSGRENAWATQHWKKLARLLEETREGLEETARREGFAFLPVLDKEQSRGGARQRSYYRLAAQPISTSETPKTFEVPDGGLRYRSERRQRVPWLGRLYVGVPMGRSRVFSLLAILALFLVAAFAVVSPLLLRPFLPIRVDLAEIALGFAVLGGLYSSLFGALFRVATWKVAVAPLWFVPGDELEPLLLEEIRDPEDSKAPKRIELVKYTGVCPICGGRVVAGSGGLRFRARLVGRCQRSPREHVFSFDHVTRVGERLR